MDIRRVEYRGALPFFVAFAAFGVARARAVEVLGAIEQPFDHPPLGRYLAGLQFGAGRPFPCVVVKELVTTRSTLRRTGGRTVPPEEGGTGLIPPAVEGPLLCGSSRRWPGSSP